MQDGYETVACARTYASVSDRLPRDNYSPRYMRRLRAARYKPRKNSEECRGAVEKMECEMFSRTSALTRVRGTRSNRAALLLLRDVFRDTIFFLETLVNISVKGAAGELARPTNRNRPGLTLSKNYSQDTLGRAGAKRASRRARSCP